MSSQLNLNLRINKKYYWISVVPLFLLFLFFLISGIIYGVTWMIIIFSILTFLYSLAMIILIVDYKLTGTWKEK